MKYTRLIAALVLVVVFIAFWGPCAQAQTSTGCATLTWTPATENTDGTPYTDPDGYNLYWSATSGGPYVQEIRLSDSALTSHEVCDLAAGDWFFVITSVNAAGVESAYSVEASKTIVLPSEPNPPSNLTVVSTVAYQLLKITDDLIWNGVGTVPGDTPCNPNVRVLAQGVTRYAVPRAVVSWAQQGLEPQVVFAECG